MFVNLLRPVVWVWLIIVCLVTGCTPGRYALEQDVGPANSQFDAASIPPVIPRYEPLSRSGNQSPYVVNGETYHINFDTHGFRQQGVASWYGQKFHGYHTANGEVYNMYALTAAHKTLPLPSFLKVTNQINGKSVVVRVNDRGPFHDDRILDLSYAAALQLGYMAKGTAPVDIEVIIPADTPQKTNMSPVLVGTELVPGHGFFIQQGAFSDQSSLEKRAGQIKSKADLAVMVNAAEHEGKPLYRLWLGPFYQRKAAEQALQLLKKAGISGGLIITRPVEIADELVLNGSSF